MIPRWKALRVGRHRKKDADACLEVQGIKVTQEGIITLPTEQGIDINSSSREIPLAHTDVHPLSKLVFQLGAQTGQLTLGDSAILLVTLLPATTTP
jgi:hypothetical protein